MKIKSALFIPLLALGFTAKAEDISPSQDLINPTQDLSSLASDPRLYIEALASDQDTLAKRMPKACQEAKVTSEQNTLIKEAVYKFEKEMLQTKTELQLAFMDFDHTVKDPASDIAAAQNVGAKISDSVTKIATSHLNLATLILYNILKPEQKESAYACLKAMAKSSIRQHMKEACSKLGGHHPGKPDTKPTPPVQEPEPPTPPVQEPAPTPPAPPQPAPQPAP